VVGKIHKPPGASRRGEVANAGRFPFFSYSGFWLLASIPEVRMGEGRKKPWIMPCMKVK